MGAVQEVKIEKGIVGRETRLSRGTKEHAGLAPSRGTKEHAGLAQSSPMAAAQGVWEGSGWRLGLGLRRIEKRLARPISKAEELSFYLAGDK